MTDQRNNSSQSMKQESEKPKEASVIQLAMSIGTAIIGVGLLAFPRITVNYVMTAAPAATAMAVLFVLGIGILVAYLGSQYPQLTMFEYGDQLLGKWVGCIIHALLSFYYLELAALATREFGEVVVTSVLQRTPVEVTVLTMLILAAIASRNNVFVVIRILTYYMPWVYFPVIVIVLLTLKGGNELNLQPWFHITHPMSLLKAVLTISALFQNILIAGMFIPYMIHPERAWKGILIGVGGAGSLYVILMLATLGVFGTEEIKHILWPTLDLAKTASLPVFFIERLDPIFVAVWVTAVFTGILSSYYCSIRGMAHVFQLYDHRSMSIFIFPVIFVMSLLPKNIANLYTIVEIVGQFGIILTMGYPVLLVLIHLLKKVLKKKKVLRHA
ncbi:GerAB/ArcD/ProY family transporter [Ferroacidibacillus organovorans]|uniref:Uncharacterized protein n=1 Tax=Ferroacidibacillus organovorans TaxID=1765683 RepID=A0A162UGU5_9BACL|nr:endospore germination permease [Ferroacidibacillus organovorans]KYP81748.1 hypothetical protein AYJ22_05805 [Ferroacidibacillus organovorans]OAG93737.1 hypothetical protein AYW79_09170 [Ferroacidibacillus organovorans]OPG16071.1 hypothetical protein B2M26_08470 [Ferroacidibacillus organovorans]